MRKVSQVVWKELLPLSPLFTTAEVAERADVTLSNASRDLAGLEDAGMVVRVRRGLWAVEGHPDFSTYAVVPHLFAEGAGGYVSLLSALNLHGMIEQIPRIVQVVTVRQRPKLRTPVGAYEFYRIAPELYGGCTLYRRTGRFDIGTPEKALFDTLYFSARKGRRFLALPELEVPESFSPSEVESWIERIDHRPIRIAVENRWADVADRLDVGP
jgi:predicted transcriptional regulator of viral defense system